MRPRSAILLTLGCALAYALASHQLMTRAADSPFALAIVLGPICMGLLVALWRQGHRWAAGALGLAGVGLAVAGSQRTHGVQPEWLYLAQHAGVHAGLGVWFTSTLRGSGLPLISQIAQRVHRGLSPTMAVYTRRVTAVWGAYFFAMTAISLLLFAFAPFSAWSLFANVLTPLSAVLLFVAEHFARYRLHPEFDRVPLVESLRAYNDRAQPPSPGEHA